MGRSVFILGALCNELHVLNVLACRSISQCELKLEHLDLKCKLQKCTIKKTVRFDEVLFKLLWLLLSGPARAGVKWQNLEYPESTLRGTVPERCGVHISPPPVATGQEIQRPGFLAWAGA